MGKWADVMEDYGAYDAGLNPWHSGPDYTKEEIENMSQDGIPLIYSDTGEQEADDILKIERGSK